MASLKIEPIQSRSIKNNLVHVLSIDPTDHDCLIGECWNGKDGPHPAVWNLSGIKRGGPESCNLDMSSDEMIELAKLTRKLGAK